MAKIPQAFSESILTGGINIPVPQGAFGVDISGVGKGIQDLASGLSINARTRKAIEDRTKEKNDSLWAARAHSNYAQDLTGYEVTPENRSKVGFVNDVMGYASDRKRAYLEEAPSPEAARRFEEQAISTNDSRFPRYASIGAENEMRADMEAIDNTFGNSLLAFHQLNATDPEAASSDLLDGLRNVTNTIYDTYSVTNPEVAKKMQAQKVVETAFALGEKSPATAKELINSNSALIDEEMRISINAKIDRMQENSNLLLKEDFNTVREKNMIGAQRDGTYTPLPLTDYISIVGQKDQALIMKQRDDAKATAYTNAHQFLSTTQGVRPDRKIEMASNYQKTLDTEDKLQAFAQVVAPALTKEQHDFQGDPSAYIQRNNPSLQTLKQDADQIDSNEQGVGVDEGSSGVLPPKESPGMPNEIAGIKTVPKPNQAPAAREQYYKSVLKYQGYPSEGEDPDKFMNLAPSQRHLLTKDEAQHYANQINGADIDSVIGTANSLLKSFPTDELRNQAIRDLSELPNDKVKPEYQIIFQNATQPWISDFIGNMRSVGDIKDMSPVDVNEVKAKLQANPIWASFRSSILGPQNQRSEQMKGIGDAIEMDAKAMVFKGMKPKDAVEASVKRVLNSTMKPVTISKAGLHDSGGVEKFLDGELMPGPQRDSLTGNGKLSRWEAPDFWRQDHWFVPDRFVSQDPQVWIPRRPAGWDHDISDSDLDDLGRRMGVATSHINPNDVDINQFASVKQTDDTEKQKRLIHQHIVDTGRYVAQPGGSKYLLTVAGPDGARTNLRDKEGNFFQLDLATVPAYTYKTKEMSFTPQNYDKANKSIFTNGPAFKPYDYPYNDLDSDGYPNTGKFWEHIK